MDTKYYAILVYALLGLIIALWPFFFKGKNSASYALQFFKNFHLPSALFNKIVILLILSLSAILVTGEKILSLNILCFCLIALGTSILSAKVNVIDLLTAFLTICVSSTIPWWERQDGHLIISNIKLLFFSLLTLLFIRLFSVKTAANKHINNSKVLTAWIAGYVIIAAILSFSTGILHDTQAFRTLWHHWGAYIAPSELLLSGAKIFNDFPVQYGFGPTILIAKLCGNDCWQAMYYIVGFSNLVFSVLIAVMAFTFSRDRWGERLAVMTICLAVCFLWTAFPPHACLPLVTPSVMGLRFLPAVILTTYLFFNKDVESSKLRKTIAHILWAMGALWSPESAFYVTFIWWPYYLFIQQNSTSSRTKTLFRSALSLLSIAISLVVTFCIVYKFVYSQYPSLYGYIVYAIHPPGSMPINYRGGILFFLLALFIGTSSLLLNWYRENDTIAFRRGFLIQLLCYSVLSYFLGRSHDNNLLNLMPFLFLLLFYTITTTDSVILSKSSVVLLSTFIGWLALFGWHPWNTTFKENKLLEFNSKLFNDRFYHNDMRFGISQNVIRAIDYIDINYGEPMTVLDSLFCLKPSIPPKVWSAIHDPANYVFIPSLERRRFLCNTAKKLNRAGWLVVDKKFLADEWLADYDFVYIRTNYIDFGTYYAIRYTPKIKIANSPLKGVSFNY
jgi:hypothetical protein